MPKKDATINIQKGFYGVLVVGIFLFVSYCFFVLAITRVNAQIAPEYSLYLDKPTISRGYTVSLGENNLQIGVLPNTVTRPVTVEFFKPLENVDIPLDKTLNSDIYIYSVAPVTSNTLETPINIKFYYLKDDDKYKKIYAYDFDEQKWNSLAGSVNKEQGYVTASTNKASGLIAVLSDNLAGSEILKEKINAPTIFLSDAKTGEILVERNSDIKRSIASLTKMMTAAVFLDNNPGWDAPVTMIDDDDTIPVKIYVKPGATLTTRDLFYASLIPSANNATKALARSTGLTNEEFAQKMNEKAAKLGMENTVFAEPTGLSSQNQSTAQDYLKLTKYVLANPLFLQVTTLKSYSIFDIANRQKIALTNSNKALDSPYIITGSKTGYTTEAGRCLMVRAKNKNGREVIAIIMGVTKPGSQWDDINLLLDAALGGEINLANL